MVHGSEAFADGPFEVPEGLQAEVRKPPQESFGEFVGDARRHKALRLIAVVCCWVQVTDHNDVVCVRQQLAAQKQGLC